MRLLLLLALAASVAGVAVWQAGESPSHERDWVPEQAVLPRVTLRGDTAIVAGLRAFRHTSDSTFDARRETQTYSLRTVESVWYVLSPFNPDWRGPAHSFLSFGFADGRYLAVSVEARREAGEAYSTVKGALRQYELIVVLGDERDLVGLRAVTWDDPVYLYPGRATPAQARQILEALLRRAAAVEARPEFYHTLTNNCTTNLLDAINAARDEPISAGPRVLLPGYSDALAHELGLLDTDLPLDEARQRYRINERAQAAAGAEDFSAAIRR